MRTISTGEPSTLKTYKSIARFFGPDVIRFIDDKIASNPNGENEEVVAEESQVINLFAAIMKEGKNKIKEDIVPEGLFQL